MGCFHFVSTLNHAPGGHLESPLNRLLFCPGVESVDNGVGNTYFEDGYAWM